MDNYKRVPTRFGPETGFEVRLGPPALLQARQEAEFERLKAQLLSERLALRPGRRAQPSRCSGRPARPRPWRG